MKIGVILHGQLRTGLSCAKYIKELFDDYDADFFIHLWDVSDNKMLDEGRYTNPKYTDKIIPIKPNEAGPDTTYYHTSDEFNKMKEIYKPKYFSTSRRDNDYELAKTELTKEGEVGVMGCYSALKALFGLSMYQSKTKSKYDLIIRMRPDAIVPKSQIIGFHKSLKEYKQNPKRFYCEYQLGNLSKFPIIDYYQIGNYNNMVELHKWVYEREFGKDIDLQKVVEGLIQSGKLIAEGSYFKTVIIRNIMDDARYIKLLYETWNNDGTEKEDIWNHMITYMNPIPYKEYYGEHVDEPLTKEKIINNVIKLYSK
tara:strand:- start:5603 stop:6535 length:933 start_codon:yes stop_codon:yes gene_type:complete